MTGPIQHCIQPMFGGFLPNLHPGLLAPFCLSKELVEEVKDRSVLLREACQRCVISHAAQCFLSILQAIDASGESGIG